jgi:uncharacterized LabA/DUF88 family protein
MGYTQNDVEMREFLMFLHESTEEYFLEYASLYKHQIYEFMRDFFPMSTVHSNDKIMVFVDGENLAIRYGKILEDRDIEVPKHVFYEPNVYVWSVGLNNVCVYHRVLRKYYYTSIIEKDHTTILACIDQLKLHNIQEPKVFKRTKNRHSKGVDISLATDMLTHAFRRNYDIAVLVAGDGDYVPLVKAIKNEGCQVFLWFFDEKGLSDDLRRNADNFTDIGKILFSPDLSPFQR